MSDTYSRSHPFYASIKQRYSLCQSKSSKETQHFEVSLKGSGMKYKVGDSIAVLPSNDPGIVQKTLESINASGDEIVSEKRSEDTYPLREFLSIKANLTDFSPKFVSELCKRQTNPEKKEKLSVLLKEGAEAELKNYQLTHEIWESLQENTEAAFTPQELCQLLKPMMPRFYSIASSMEAVGEEAHLTVALQKWNSNGKERLGVCTHYLCHMVSLNEPMLPIYIHPSNGFTLPEDSSAPIIMIGPGTGVAPFRAFMQERDSLNAPGKNWLFFGEWNRLHHFFYEEYWNSLVEKGKLSLDVAFSRDQEQKVYVQDRMLEKGAELFKWLQEGAFIYVCGDALKMAKDVEAALVQIIENHGNCTDTEAKEYIKKMRKEKRYLKDVY